MGLGSSKSLGSSALIAAGSYNGAAAGAAAAYGERGAVVTRTGAGVYLITLDGNNAVDSTEGVVIATAGGAARGAPAIAHTSDTVKTITWRTGAAAPAAVDVDMEWAVFRFAP